MVLGLLGLYQVSPETEYVSGTSLSSEVENETLSVEMIEEIKSKIETFKVESNKCNIQYEKGIGFGYKYERDIKTLLNVDSVGNIFLQQDESGHSKFRILENGLASLWARIDLIRRAKKTIELEYFIYRIRENKTISDVTSIKSFLTSEKKSHINQSTIILTKELLKKALSGVKVRVLVDASGTVWTFKEDMLIAAQLHLKKIAEEAGIDYNKVKDNFQFKIYNKKSLIQISSLNFRNHRKLLMVDDKYAITGGRNIEDKYFDLDPYYNFHDRDVLITYEPNNKPAVGGLLPAMKNSFNFYWNEKKVSENLKLNSHRNISKYLTKLFTNNDSSKLQKYLDKPRSLNIDTEDDFFKMRIRKALKKLKKTYGIFSIDTSYVKGLVEGNGKSNFELTKKHNCKKATYVSDRSIPKGIFALRLSSLFRDKTYKEDYRFTGRVLEEKLRSVFESGKKEIIISSPYLSLNCRTNKIAQSLVDQDAKFSIYTNSLASTDAIYNASLFYKRADKFLSSGAKLYAHSAKSFHSGENKYSFIYKGDDKISVLDSRWGLHSKSHVYGDDTIYIGTYNMDNRSSFYNTEMGVFCEGSKGLANELKYNILKRVNNASISISSVEKRKAKLMIDDSEIDPHGETNQDSISFMYKIFPFIEKLEILF